MLEQHEDQNVVTSSQDAVEATGAPAPTSEEIAEEARLEALAVTRRRTSENFFSTHIDLSKARKPAAQRG